MKINLVLPINPKSNKGNHPFNCKRHVHHHLTVSGFNVKSFMTIVMCMHGYDTEYNLIALLKLVFKHRKNRGKQYKVKQMKIAPLINAHAQ